MDSGLAVEIETTMTSSSSFQDDSYDSSLDERPKERMAPLGAIASPTPSASSEQSEQGQLKLLEEEQQQLNSSLLALTSHFAQVQFRLKQIISSPAESKEDLLKELEEFAFQGCPDVRGSTSQDAQILEDMSTKEREIKLNQQREKQMELIGQLKGQLDDLEMYAYQEGSGQLPQTKVMEKQRVVLDQLRHTLDLNLEGFDKLTTEDLRRRVDYSIGKIVNPAKVKEKMLSQLKTQIVDLERFISFLQGESSSPGPFGQEDCTCKVHKRTPFGSNTSTEVSSDQGRGRGATGDQDIGKHSATSKRVEETVRQMKKLLGVLQMVAVSQFGCGSEEAKKAYRAAKEADKDYSGLVKGLQGVVDQIVDLIAEQSEEEEYPENDYDSDDSDDDSAPAKVVDDITIVVRKKLAPTLRDLLQHGLYRLSRNRSMVTPISCLVPRSSYIDSQMHAWDLFMEYFDMKHGKAYASTPARKLSQAYGLEIVGGSAVTVRQTLLAAIDTVETSHAPLKRSKDARFKAFVCQGLNSHKLTAWFRLVCRTPSLIDGHYVSSSYMVKTGFDQALLLLEKLTPLKFDLASDLAVRPFNNIKDAF